jgi:hypothetical protein
METTLGISLYLYLKLTKTMSFLLSPMFCLQQNQKRGFCTEAENEKLGKKNGGKQWGEVAQTMYTYISKCNNDKIKERKK